MHVSTTTNELQAPTAEERIRAALAAKPTPGPWIVFNREHPHYLGGKHIEANIYCGWDHPQVQGPLPVVATSTGIGAERGSPGINFSFIRERDATHIAACNPKAIAELLAMIDELRAATAPNAGAAASMGREIGRWEPDEPTGFRWAAGIVRGSFPAGTPIYVSASACAAGQFAAAPAQQAGAPACSAPAAWVSPEQFEAHPDGGLDGSGRYLPMRKSMAGKFTKPLYTRSCEHGCNGCDDCTDYEPTSAGAPLPLAPSGAAFVYHCRAWGESDQPASELLLDFAAVGDFMVREWLGDADHTHDDGTLTLSDLLAQWQGQNWEKTPMWVAEFEIGGVSVERLTCPAPIPYDPKNVIGLNVAAPQADAAEPEEVAALIVRDVAESDPADPEHPSTLCVRGEDLAAYIVNRLEEKAAAQAPGARGGA